MSLVQSLKSALGLTESPTDENDTDRTSPADEKPCNISGHNYEDGRTKLYGTFARRRSGFTAGTTFTIYRDYFNYCSKCDDFKKEKETLGKVSVDKDGNLSVKNQ